VHNRSVYAIAYPAIARKNKKDSLSWPGWPRLNAGALPPGVMVFALLDDSVNLKNLHIQHEGKNPCHPQAAATCTYRRTLAPILA